MSQHIVWRTLIEGQGSPRRSKVVSWVDGSMAAAADHSRGAGRAAHRVGGRADLQARLQTARERFTGEIERGLGGRAAHGRYADRIDDLVRHLVASADASPMPVAVAALGGYGRRTLCLHSDIDLLIVFHDAIGDAEERFIKQILHPLWDLHLTVGHQVRVLADFDVLERDNPEFLLSLLDARLLAGDPHVFEPLERAFRHPPRESRDVVLEALQQLMADRHGQYNDTIYQLEPDVKEAPGGLRDLAAARILTLLTDDSTAALVDDDKLDEAENFLLRVRSVLHLAHRRNQNVLSHDLQEIAAETLRIAGAGTQQRVEALMGRYFAHAHVVQRALARAMKLATPTPVVARTSQLGPNLDLTPAGVGFIDAEVAAGEPSSWLDAIESALEHGVPIADTALALMERRASRYSWSDLLPTPSHRQRLVRVLRPRAGLYARLEQLHGCGLLGRLLPGFDAIAHRVIRDFYHKYTVDEHTLLTIRGLERLLDGGSGRERFGAVLGELHAPERLVLALLFHDVGKWKEEDHAVESVRMAQALLDGLELPDEARQDIRFLIGTHLEMSRMALRSDAEDPRTVHELTALVGTEERLKMLTLLTLVDIDAVSPDALTPWKEDLLWRLYVDTYNQLTIAYGDEIIDRGQAAVAALQATRPSDLSELELARFLEGFPQRYLSLFDSAHVYEHARLARDIRAGEVHLFLEPKGDVWELAVVTLDRPMLFATICGVLSYCGMDILRGSAMTSPIGLVLDIFQFADTDGFLRLNPDGAGDLGALLQDAVAGRQDVAALIARREAGLRRRRLPRRIAPVVTIDNDHSRHYTAVEIVAQDAIGLLYRISRVLASHDCAIDLVLIATEGNKAIDVFHLTRAGAKLLAAEQESLTRDVKRMLEDSYEED